MIFRRLRDVQRNLGHNLRGIPWFHRHSDRQRLHHSAHLYIQQLFEPRVCGRAASGLSGSISASPSISCPGCDGNTYYASNNQVFEIQCGIYQYGGDVGATWTSSMSICITSCASTSGCLAVSYVGGSLGSNCYMKNQANAGFSNSGSGSQTRL